MKKIILLTVIFSSLTSCFRPPIEVNVDAISVSNAREKKRYFLIPGNKDCSPSDLQFMEFARYTDNALTCEGFIKVESIEEADIVVILNYGISDPYVYQYTYETPIWGQTGVSSETTYGSISTFGNMATYSSQTNYTPTYGVVGSKTQVGTGVLFFRYIVLSGMDLEKFKQTNKVEDAKSLWVTKANSTGSSSDLRKIFPILLVASQDHIARNTDQQVHYKIKENDKRLEKIKKQ